MHLSNQEPSKTTYPRHLNTSIGGTNPKIRVIILKLDFQKAFYMIEYSSIMVVMKHMRLEINGSPRLTPYIRNSAIRAVILNEVHGKTLFVREESDKGTHYPHYSLLLLQNYFKLRLTMLGMKD
jgi:hypothetical protein